MLLGTALVARSMLGILECISQVSCHVSLPCLNTAIGNIVVVLTSITDTLVRIEGICNEDTPGGQPSRTTTATATTATATALGSSSLRSAEVTGVVTSCYRLLCRVLSSLSASKEASRHCPLIAAAFMDTVARLGVSRLFKDTVFPGVFALLDKCQLKQKNQMYAVLDARSRALMTDVHQEFMRTYKFQGK